MAIPDWLWQISSFNELKNLDSIESYKAKIFFIKIAFLNSDKFYLAKLEAIILSQYIIALEEPDFWGMIIKKLTVNIWRFSQI
ncbi:hypothetical protein [Microcystis aeruginosa]|uniref:hypothetical protein n=1 Tax=Microcystis aeruginosa TaxID=1126 RepID=UPI00232AD239|nr:hypothetical protein [Microcystis aeruginosa]MDB9434088.1 hypothetical protein [Microcystis aeruginosa CS-552/01]